MHDKFSRRIEAALERLAARIARSKKRLDPTAVNRQIGRILQQNQRAAARFAIALEPDGCPAGFRLRIDYSASFDHWAALSEGAYLLRSNISDWSDRQLWRAYIQLTQAEAAFRIQKDQLNVRPIWHQRDGRYLTNFPREQSSKNLRASSPTMSCCRPRHTAKFAYAASPSPTPPRRLCLTVLASSCPSACALPCPSGKPSLRPPEPGPRPKCSDDFSAKALICPDPTPNSAQVGLRLGSRIGCVRSRKRARSRRLSVMASTTGTGSCASWMQTCTHPARTCRRRSATAPN